MAGQNPHFLIAARAALPVGQWQALLIKAGFGLLLACIFGWLLANRLAEVPITQMRAAVSDVTAIQWLTAILATLASFWAIGHCDGVIHRHLVTGIANPAARRAGATAIAVSQTIGLGVITGALLRWRMLPGLTLWQATKLSSHVVVFFFGAWAIVTAIVLAALPQAPFKPIAVGGLGVMLACLVAMTLHPRPPLKQMPNLFIIARLVALAAVDTVMAGLALWALCPPDLTLPFTVLLPAFLIAFGAGLASGTPGGVGAFELTLLGLLPQTPETPLLAAVLAWRLVYYTIPALAGAMIALRGPADTGKARDTLARGSLLHSTPRAETRLLSQGHLSLTAAGQDNAWLTGRTPHCLIGVLDPLLPDGPDTCAQDSTEMAIAALAEGAALEGRFPAIYKCNARTAVTARKRGLTLRPVAREAWLDPCAFTLAAPSRSGLRRKLRHASLAGISISTGPHDWEALARIAQEWSAAHGGERGFSMGRYERSYVAQQRVFVAYLGRQAVAFASFHTGKTEWTLDLMRSTSKAPDGTMHAAICAAITEAATLGLPRLSLAALPMAALYAAPTGRLARMIHRAAGGNQTGLAQFKSAFAPRWQTLYLAAPHVPGLVLAALEIARAVHFPPALRPVPHHRHEQYEIATAA